MDNDVKSRREFLKKTILAAAAVPALALFRFKPLEAYAAKEQWASPSDPLAKAIGYVEKTPKKGQTCDNCALYVKKDGTKGTCPIVQNKLVKPKGWCKSWAPMPKK